jgi:hypothetical protein
MDTKQADPVTPALPIGVDAIEAKLVALTAAFATLVFGAYFVFFAFRKTIAGDPNSWGEFGDFFGGMVNPVVGIVTVILVVRTLKVTREEASSTRIELAKQSAQLEAQTRHLKAEQDATERQRRLDGWLASWNELIHLERNATRKLGLSAPPPTLAQVFNNPSTPLSIKQIQQAGNWVGGGEFQRSWRKAIAPEIQMLEELAGYCIESDVKFGNSLLADFYRRRVRYPVAALARGELISDSVKDALSVKGEIVPIAEESDSD